MVRFILLATVLIAALAAGTSRAHAKTSAPAQLGFMKTTCENLGPGNDLCLFAEPTTNSSTMEKAERPLPRIVVAQSAAVAVGVPTGTQMVTGEELKGGAAGIENDFVASTVLEDATEISESNEVSEGLALAQALKAQEQVRSIEAYLHSISGPSISGRVSEAGRRSN